MLVSLLLCSLVPVLVSILSSFLRTVVMICWCFLVLGCGSCACLYSSLFFFPSLHWCVIKSRDTWEWPGKILPKKRSTLWMQSPSLVASGPWNIPPAAIRENHNSGARLSPFMAFPSHAITRHPLIVRFAGSNTKSQASASTGACMNATETSAVSKLRSFTTETASTQRSPSNDDVGA